MSRHPPACQQGDGLAPFEVLFVEQERLVQLRRKRFCLKTCRLVKFTRFTLRAKPGNSLWDPAF